MKEMLEKIQKSALDEIAQGVATEDIRIKYLGKKGELTKVLRGMGALSAEERPVVGALANTVRANIEAALKEAEENFLIYAKTCTYLGIESVISSYTKAKQLKSILNTDDEKINAIIDNAGAKLEKVAHTFTKLGKDETNHWTECSVEGCGAKDAASVEARDAEKLLGL